MLDIVRAQALALTTEAWNVASIAKQRRSRRSTCTQEKEATLLRAAAEKAIGKRLSKRHRHEDREIGYGRQLSGNLKSGKMIIADDLDNRTQSPWRVRGVARSLGVTAYAWRQLHTWALLQLCEISGAEHQILSAFRRAYASVRPPSAYAAWVMVESVARLRCSIHRWDRADGPALSLILLKSAGDAMMKKTDVYDPKRPAAQKTRRATCPTLSHKKHFLSLTSTRGCLHSEAVCPLRLQLVQVMSVLFRGSGAPKRAASPVRRGAPAQGANRRGPPCPRVGGRKPLWRMKARISTCSSTSSVASRCSISACSSRSGSSVSSGGGPCASSNRCAARGPVRLRLRSVRMYPKTNRFRAGNVL